MALLRAQDPAHQLDGSTADRTHNNAQQHFQNGRPAGAIKSASRFDGASIIATKAKMQFMSSNNSNLSKH